MLHRLTYKSMYCKELVVLKSYLMYCKEVFVLKIMLDHPFMYGTAVQAFCYCIYNVYEGSPRDPKTILSTTDRMAGSLKSIYRISLSDEFGMVI